MKLTWFGHSAFRIDLPKAVIMIDPFLTGNPGFTGKALDAARGATHVVLTHGHNDHVGDAAAICKAYDATLIANYDLAMWLVTLEGLSRIDPGNTGGTVHHDGFSVSFTQAIHSSGEILDLRKEGGPAQAIYHGNPNGIIITAAGEKTLYHAGDTDIFGDMALIQEIYEPQIALLPVGDRFTMSGKTAAMAARRFLKPQIAIPMHYGTFDIIDPDASKFIAAMDGSGIEVVVPEIGKAIEL